MRYDNIRAFEKHLEGSAPNHFSNLYLIIGKESFECKEAADKLLAALLPDEKSRAFCLCLFDGEQLSLPSLFNELRSISFLAAKKVVWIQQIDKLKKQALDELEQEFSCLYHKHYLILSGSSCAKTSSFYKAVDKAGIILDFPEIKPWEKEKRLIEWVGKQAAAERKTMSHHACQYLVKSIGLNQALLQQELDKLICYCGERKEISLQDVGTLSIQTHVDTIWQLGEAVLQCETLQALKVAKGLLQEGSALLPLLRQIRSQLQTSYHICTLLEREGAPAAVAQEYPYMKGPILERNLQLARYYGLHRFKKGLLALDEAEMQAKNSALAEELLIELLIVKLTHS